MLGIRLKTLSQITGLALAGLMTIAPQASHAESLGDALVGAYRNSALLEQNRALLRAADEGVAFEVGKLRPVLSYALTQSRSSNALGVSNSTTASLSANMLLWDFGRTQLGVEAQKETVLATRQALLDIEQSVLSGAVSAYIQVRTAAELVALRNNNVRLITEQLRAANDRFEVGEVTRTDVALAEARLAQARSNLVSAEGDFAIARESYNISVGRYPGNLTAPPTPPRTASTLPEAKAIAVRTHPAIKQAQHVVRANELASEAAQQAVMPRLNGSASVGRDIFNQQNTTSLSITLSGPIYSGGQISSGYRRAVASTEASRAQLRRAVQSVEQQVANAWFGIEVARARIEASDRQIRASTVAFRGVREEATLGARTTLDVLDAEQDLLDARTARVNAEAEAVRAVYTLLSSMGLLTVDHLGLGIPTYDPAAYYNAVKDAPATSTRGAALDRVLGRIGNN
jgi:outer membrane protein